MMAAIYVALIKKGLKIIDDVPEIIREAVKKMLDNKTEESL